MTLKRAFVAVSSAIAIAAMSAPASAATFVYNVNYDDAGTATLAPGSDDLRGVNLVAGDMITYTVTATGLNGWTVLFDDTPSFTFALPLTQEGSRTVDVDFSLNLNGANVLFQSDTGLINEQVHLGPNGTPLTEGLQFDQFSFNLTLLSAEPIDDDDFAQNFNGMDVDTTVASLLPIFGAPEQEASIEFGALQTGAIPEPGTWAMLIFGFGLIGAAMRRRRQNVTVSYA